MGLREVGEQHQRGDITLRLLHSQSYLVIIKTEAVFVSTCWGGRVLPVLVHPDSESGENLLSEFHEA